MTCKEKGSKVLKDTIGDSTVVLLERRVIIKWSFRSQLPLYNTKWPSYISEVIFSMSEEPRRHFEQLDKWSSLEVKQFYFSVTFIIVGKIFIQEDVVSIWYTKKLAVSIQHWKWKGRRRGPKVTEHFLSDSQTTSESVSKGSKGSE